MNRLSLSVVSVLALLLAAACGDDGGDNGNGNGSPDAANNPTPDAASDSPDAAGQDPDAAVSDAGPDVDAEVPDAGPDVDAGPAPEVLINEFLMDQNGNDVDEFVELKGDPNTDYTGLSLLQVDGDDAMGLNPGTILTVNAGCTTDANGYCVIDVNANTFQNGSQTLLLVSGSGPFLDVDIDANDDGTIDNEPWDALIDAVAVFDNVPDVDNTDKSYAGDAVLTKVSDNGQPTAFGGASRIPDGTDTDAAADWTSNTPSFDNSGIVSGEARNTPGVANSVEP